MPSTRSRSTNTTGTGSGNTSSSKALTALNNGNKISEVPVGRVATKRKNVSTNSQEVPKKNRVQKEQGDADCKTLKFTGIVPVDEECKQCQSFQVYVAGENIYNAMLNQTNVGQNNNKYYLLQVLKHNSKAEYCVWFRWGRVGKIAGTNLQRLPLDKAIAAFEKKFQDKTKNSWANRNNFEKFPQKYDLLQMDYGKDEVKPKEKDAVPKVQSKLDLKVQGVMNLLFDVDEFEQSVKEMQYDIKKAPLGKLTEQQIKCGYSSLRNIEKCLKKGDFGKKLTNACSEFYTRIPHDFGMKRPPLIRSPQDMKLKLHLLEALSDIKIAISIMDDAEKEKIKENPLDMHYKSLNCSLCPIASCDEEYKLIEQYLTNTHAATHNNYKLQMVTLFHLSKPDNDHQFMKEFGNRVLLWHGSRLTNWCGILKRGLQIAPPEAPVTGYMYGKGVYFADMVTKSANYCFATPRQPIGFLILCEVALGSTNEKLVADYEADKLPKGKHSTKGIGKTTPNPEESKILEDGTVVPLGKPIAVASARESALLYNEYVVYNAKQIRPRYLVQVRFIFTKSW